MKKLFKTILASVLALTTIGLTSCFANNGDYGNSSVNGGGSKLEHISNPWWTTTGTLNKDANGAPKFENVTINLTTIVTGSDYKPFQELVAEFNKVHQGQIQVNVVNENEATFAQNLGNRIQNNNNPPDLLMSHAKLQKTLANKKWTQPLEDIVEATGYEMNWDNYSYVLASEATLGYDNATFTIPIDMQSEVVLYNKTILNELGKNVPTTRSELLDVCAAFKAKYSTSDGYYAISMPTNNHHFHPYVYPTAYLQNGGSLYNVNNYKAEWTSDVNSQAFADANEAILSLVEADYMKLNETEGTAQNRFNKEQTLFLVIPPWNIMNSGGVFQTYAEENNISKNDANYVANVCQHIGGMSLSGLFAMDESKPYAESVYVDSHSFSISTSVKDINKKAACLYFAKWFTENGEIGAKWAQAGHSSCSATIINSDAYKNDVFVKNLIQNFYDVNVIKTMGNNPYSDDLVEALGGLTPSLLSRPTQLEDLIKQKQKAYNGIIELNEEY